jgi:hypothetical protein
MISLKPYDWSTIREHCKKVPGGLWKVRGAIGTSSGTQRDNPAEVSGACVVRKHFDSLDLINSDDFPWFMMPLYRHCVRLFLATQDATFFEGQTLQPNAVDLTA